MTFIEVMFSIALFFFIVAAVTTVFVTTMKNAIETSFHLSLISQARTAEYRMAKNIQGARAVSATADRLSIVQADLSTSEIQFVDLDNDPETVEDNILRYDPDVLIIDNEMTICNFVTPIEGEDMFRVVATTPSTAIITFHIGRIPPKAPGLLKKSKESFVGVEVRMSATPRNYEGFYN